MNYVSGFELYMQSLAIGLIVVLGFGSGPWPYASDQSLHYISMRIQCFSDLT